MADADRLRGDAFRIIGDIYSKLELLTSENMRLREEQTVLIQQNTRLRKKLALMKSAMDDDS